MSDKKTAKENIIDLSSAGEYYYGLGRRKTSTATARMYFNCPNDLKGKIFVNNTDAKKYFPVELQIGTLTQPLKAAGIKKNDVMISLKISGGGSVGQSEAARLAISKALVAKNEDYKSVLRAAGFLTRDPRMKERKKPGLRRARRAPQWTKR